MLNFYICQLWVILIKCLMVKTFVYEGHCCLIGPVLREKQKSLNLEENGLIIDVKTRWNSTYDMLERYLQQDTAIYAALNNAKLKSNAEVCD